MELALCQATGNKEEMSLLRKSLLPWLVWLSWNTVLNIKRMWVPSSVRVRMGSNQSMFLSLSLPL